MLTVLARLHQAGGHLDDAIGAVDEAQSRLDHDGLRVLEGTAWCLKGELLLSLGRNDEARTAEARARACADHAGVAPGSELGRRLDGLSRRLGG